MGNNRSVQCACPGRTFAAQTALVMLCRLSISQAPGQLPRPAAPLAPATLLPGPVHPALVRKNSLGARARAAGKRVSQDSEFAKEAEDEEPAPEVQLAPEATQHAPESTQHAPEATQRAP